MKGVAFCFVLFLVGCALQEPSQMMTGVALKEVAAVQATVKKIEAQTPPVCKTEAFMSQLETIHRQVSGIGGHIESIAAACQTEKAVLKERVTTREAVIFGLGVLLLVLGGCLMKRR